jgi:hypothetical protein
MSAVRVEGASALKPSNEVRVVGNVINTEGNAVTLKCADGSSVVVKTQNPGKRVLPMLPVCLCVL